MGFELVKGPARQRKETTMRKLMTAAAMLVMLLAVAAPGVADARPIPGDVPGDRPRTEEFDWTDCIWGDAPATYIVASFRAKDNNEYALECRNVWKIYKGHGFNGDTIPCIDHVLTSYDSKGPSKSDPRNDLFKINRLISSKFPDRFPGSFIDAFVVTERHSQRIVTAFVEIGTIQDLPQTYSGDEWEACTYDSSLTA